MFWKKKQVTAAPVVEGAAGATAKPVKVKKEKPLSPKEIMARKFEQLEATGSCTYRLSPDRGGWLITVSINPQYPTKGKKYVMTVDRMTGGTPGKDKSVLFDSNHAKEMAEWIIDRQGQAVN
jgi:hypothetical protein